jgi:hypothetical protein
MGDAAEQIRRSERLWNDLLVPHQVPKSHKRFIWRRLWDEKRYFPPLSCP